MTVHSGAQPQVFAVPGGGGFMGDQLPMWAKEPSVNVGPVRPGRYVPNSQAPSLPSMPAMLPEEPAEAAVTAAALTAMAPGVYTDDSREKATATGVRVVLFAAVALVLATLAWGVAWVVWDADPLWLLVAWVAAFALTMVYLLTTEGTSRKYSAAGIEHAKIQAAVELHRDRLESRERMHEAATGAWERTLSKYMDTWKGQGE